MIKLTSKLLTKKSLYKLPKENDEDLIEILDNHDTAGFIRWVQENADADHGPRWSLPVMSQAQAMMYTRLLSKCADKLSPMMQDPYNFPRPLCGSSFYGSGVKIPIRLVENFGTEVLLDEYFGACYQSQRWKNRYEPGTEEVMKKLIRSKIKLPQLMSGQMGEVATGGLSLVGIDTLDDLFGESAVRAWWTSMTPEQYVVWKKQADSWLYDDLILNELIARYGEIGPKK
jgi:hypothetical protein